MNFKYIVDYAYGEVGNEVGCHTYNQAKEIAEAIALYVKTTADEKIDITIFTVSTGESEKFYV